MARPYSAPRERVWDMVIKQLVAQVFNLSCKSSHDVSDGNRQSKTCNFFCTREFNFYCVPAHDSRHFLLIALLTLLIHSLLKLKFRIFLLIRYRDEYCAVWCMVMNCSMAMSQTLSLGAVTSRFGAPISRTSEGKWRWLGTAAVEDKNVITTLFNNSIGIYVANRL